MEEVYLDYPIRYDRCSMSCLHARGISDLPMGNGPGLQQSSPACAHTDHESSGPVGLDDSELYQIRDRCTAIACAAGCPTTKHPQTSRAIQAAQLSLIRLRIHPTLTLHDHVHILAAENSEFHCEHGRCCSMSRLPVSAVCDRNN